MKIKPLITGIMAAISPVPLFIFTILWCWLWAFGVGIGLLGYDTVPSWILTCGLLPLTASPILGIIGVVHGCMNLKHKFAWLGIILSVIVLIENFLLVYGMYYIGSRF